MSRLLHASLAAFAIALGIASCALPGFEKVSSTASGSTGSGVGGTCNHAVPPPRPAIDDAGGALDLVFAMKTVDFGEDQVLADRPGLDLDHACTCEEAMPDQCTLPPYAMMDMRCDAADGRDNAVADLIGYIKMNTGTGSTQFTAAIALGKWSMLMRLTGYDGTPNDSKVSLSFYMTPGLAAAPKWDGNDMWPIRPESLVNMVPVIIDNDAYVSNGQLVGLVTGQFELDGGLHVKIGSGIGMGSLVQDGTTWRIDDGLLAGSWNADDALSGIGNLLYGGFQICATPFYLGVHTAVCSRVDIASAPALPCDSLSFGMRFTAEAAQLGPPAMPEMAGTPCMVDKCE